MFVTVLLVDSTGTRDRGIGPLEPKRTQNVVVLDSSISRAGESIRLNVVVLSSIN